MSKSTWKLVVNEKGQIRWWDPGARCIEQYGYHYEDNFEWEDTLKYETFGRGTSAAHLWFRSTITGKEYMMFLTDFSNIVELLVEGKLTGTFTFCKRGANYGVKYVKKC